MSETMSRWEIGLRNIVTILSGPSAAFEIKDVVEKVRELKKDESFLRRRLAVAEEELKAAREELAYVKEEAERNEASLIAGNDAVDGMFREEQKKNDFLQATIGKIRAIASGDKA